MATVPAAQGARRADRAVLFGDALLLTAGLFVVLTALALALQLVVGVIPLPESAAEALAPLVENPLFSDETWQVFGYLASVTALVGAVAAWWMHGRPLCLSMVLGFLAGLAVIAALGYPLLSASARATESRGSVPLWAMLLWGIAVVVHFAFVVWAFADGVRDIRAPIKLHRRLDWFRIFSAVLLLLLIVAVLIVLVMDLVDGAGRAFTSAVMFGYIAGFMVIGGDIVGDSLARRAERSAQVHRAEGAAPPRVSLTPELETRLARLVDRLAARKEHHHVICAIESEDGSFAWQAAVGEADAAGTPVTSETPYFIASVDKLYIATAALKLVESGRVLLDAPIASYLPESLVAGIHVLDGTDRSAEITAQHLLGHTSGLADYLEDKPKRGSSLIDQLVKGPDRSWDAEEAMRIVREDLRAHFPPQPLDAERPRVRYSDTNYQLLIALIEVQHGKPLHEVFAEQIFEPLGMKHTWMLGVSEPLEAPAAPPTALWFGKQPLELPQALVALRSTYSTAADQLASLQAIVTGAVFENPETARLMQQHWNRFALPLDAAAMRAPSWPIEYGLGMMRFELPGWSTPLGKVPPVIGHTGSTGSWLFFCPALGLFFSGTVDQATAGPVPYRFVPRLLHEIVGELRS